MSLRPAVRRQPRQWRLTATAGEDAMPDAVGQSSSRATTNGVEVLCAESADGRSAVAMLRCIVMDSEPREGAVPRENVWMKAWEVNADWHRRAMRMVAGGVCDFDAKFQRDSANSW